MYLQRLTFNALSVAAACTLMAGALAQDSVKRVGSDFLPSDAAATIVLSVADTMSSPAAELYPVEIADAWCKQKVGFLASDVDRLKLVVGAPGPGEPMGALIATLRADLDPSMLNPQVVDTTDPIDVDGHRCFQVVGAPVVLHAKDARTLILATPNYLDIVLRSEDSAATGPLAKMAASVPHVGNLTVLVAIEPIRPMVMGLLQSQADKIPPPLAEFTKVPELLDALLLRLDLENQASGLNLVMLARNDESAGELQDLIERGLKMGRQIGLAQAMQEIRGDDPVANASRQYAQRFSDYIVDSLTPTRDGRKLSLTGSASQGIATQGVLVALLLPAVQSARQAARRMASMNHLKMMGLAMHNFHATHQHFPSDITSEDGTPLLSWRVAILPFVDQVPLYEQFHLDEPWDSPHNVKLVAMMPEVYSHPGIPTPPGATVYQRPRGEAYVLRPSAEVRIRDILDGTSNTIMAVETAAEWAVEWTKPADLEIDDADPMRGVVDGQRQGFNALLADGAVLFFRSNTDPDVFKGMLTRDGKEVVNPQFDVSR